MIVLPEGACCCHHSGKQHILDCTPVRWWLTAGPCHKGRKRYFSETCARHVPAGMPGLWGLGVCILFASVGLWCPFWIKRVIIPKCLKKKSEKRDVSSCWFPASPLKTRVFFLMGNNHRSNFLSGAVGDTKATSQLFYRSWKWWEYTRLIQVAFIRRELPAWIFTGNCYHLGPSVFFLRGNKSYF